MVQPKGMNLIMRLGSHCLEPPYDVVWAGVLVYRRISPCMYVRTYVEQELRHVNPSRSSFL